MRNPSLEARLLASIAQRGIEEPLEGGGYEGGEPIAQWVQALPMCAEAGNPDGAVCVAGRRRGLGIMNLLRASNHKSLGILEQARFIDELRKLQ
jgi:hypothetical protein